MECTRRPSSKKSTSKTDVGGGIDPGQIQQLVQDLASHRGELREELGRLTQHFGDAAKKQEDSLHDVLKVNLGVQDRLVLLENETSGIKSNVQQLRLGLENNTTGIVSNVQQLRLEQQHALEHQHGLLANFSQQLSSRQENEADVADEDATIHAPRCYTTKYSSGSKFSDSGYQNVDVDIRISEDVLGGIKDLLEQLRHHLSSKLDVIIDQQAPRGDDRLSLHRRNPTAQAVLKPSESDYTRQPTPRDDYFRQSLHQHDGAAQASQHHLEDTGLRPEFGAVGPDFSAWQNEGDVVFERRNSQVSSDPPLDQEPPAEGAISDEAAPEDSTMVEDSTNTGPGQESEQHGERNSYGEKVNEHLHSVLKRRNSSRGKHFASMLPFPFNYLSLAHGRWVEFLSSKTLPTTCLARIVTAPRFNSFFMLLIFTNAMWIGFVANYEMENASGNKSNDIPWIKVVETFYIVMFSIEIVLKLGGLRWLFISGPEWQWNFFDFAMVAISVPDLFLSSSLNMSFIRILKLIRMVRVLRLFRVVGAFNTLRHMMVSMVGSLTMLFWVGVIFALMKYCFGVMLMQAAVNFIEDAESPEDLATAKLLSRKYGTIGETMTTLFNVISGGDWYIEMLPLERVNSAFKFVFVIYIFFMSFGMINVVIGLFCEQAAGAVGSDRHLRTHREKLSADSFIGEMHAIFEEMDLDGTGEIAWPEFEEYITNEGTGHFLRSHGIVTHDAKELFALLKELDGTPGGDLDMVSFVIGMQRISGGAKSTDLVLMLIENRSNARALRTAVSGIKELLDDIAKALGKNSLSTRDVHLEWETGEKHKWAASVYSE